MPDNKHYPYLAGGSWRKDGAELPVKNPFTGEVFATAARPGPDGVETAIASARRAASETAALPSWKRAEVLARTSRKIRERRDELGRIICLEAGKPIKGARTEADRTAITFETASREAFNLDGEVLPLDISPSSGDRLGITRRFPLGPVAGISPFNFPLNLVAHKIAPAVAAGNSIVLKPASATPLSALILAELLIESGFPPHAINIVPCSAEDAASLVEDDRLEMVTFTGSAEVGWGIKARAGRKKVCLELGGNAALIVEPDSDLDEIIPRTLIGAFAYAGQICISIQRIFVHENIYDEFVERFTGRAEELVVGDPLDPSTAVGPMIDEESAVKVESRIEEAVRHGARIETGGVRTGNILQPTVLTGVSSHLAVDAEEIFAPVVNIHRYEMFEDAVDRVNASRFGLQAGVYTSDLSKALVAFNRLKVGGVIINDFPTFRVDNMPYGGVKESGFGREGIRYTIEEMMELRLLVIENHR